MKTIILIFFLAFSLASLEAKHVLYVSPSGNDKEDGTLNSPLKSIQSAIDHSGTEESEIILRGSTYRREKELVIKGRRRNPCLTPPPRRNSPSPL